MQRTDDDGFQLQFESERFMIGRKINSMDGPSGVRIFEIPAKKEAGFKPVRIG